MFEDIDAIFGKDREKLLTDYVLTFSGDGRDIGTIGFVPFQLLEVSDVSSIWEFEQICRQTLMLIANRKNRRLGRIIKYTIAYTYHNDEKLDNVYPICSMYVIFNYIYIYLIWVIFMANVGKYSSTMEHMGILYIYRYTFVIGLSNAA